MEEKVGVNDTVCRSKLRDLIYFKRLFFFPLSFFLLSDAAAISTSVVFIAASRERGSQKGKLGCRILRNITSRVDFCTLPREEKTQSINRTTHRAAGLQMFMLQTSAHL